MTERPATSATPRPTALCRTCGRLRKTITGHENEMVHPLCDDPNNWWWTPEARIGEPHALVQQARTTQ